MAQIGRLDEFNPENESWSAYTERVELFMIANDVDDTKRVPALLCAVGASTYGLLRNLVQPAKPKDKTFGEIVNILKAHFEPKPLIAERFRFLRCVQKPHETVSQYVAELKRCASNCNFGPSLDEALRDRFVSGIQSEACQQRLLSEDTLTFARALEIALRMKTAGHETQQLRKTEDAAATLHNKEMELIIKLLNGDVKRLVVSGNATVGELKQLIAQHFNEPPYKQKLYRQNGHRISLDDDNRSLSSYGLCSGSVVMLLITNPGPSQVFIKNEKGQTKTYDVDVNETVDQLQTKISRKEGVPKDQQRLIYSGSQLEAGKKLQDYGITSGSTIHMTLRLRG